MKIIKIIIFICIFFALLSLFSFYFIVRPVFRIHSSITPKDLNIQYENVQFKTDDNIIIKGWFLKSKNPSAKTIILLHGYPADKGDILPSRAFLVKNFNLLLIDFRYLGESGGFYSSAGVNEILDLKAAIKYLQTKNIHEVGVWGLSLGAATSLLAATNTPEIKAIVAEAPYAKLDWLTSEYYSIPIFNDIMGNLFKLWARLLLGINVSEIQPAQSIQQINIPVLLIFYQQDNIISDRHRLLMKSISENRKNISILFIKNKNHGQLFENYQNIINSFFERNLYARNAN